MTPIGVGVGVFFVSLLFSTAVINSVTQLPISPLSKNFIQPSPQVLAKIVEATPDPTPTPAPSISPSPSIKPTPKPSATFIPSPTPKPSPTAQQLDEWFTKYSNEQSISRDLLWKIAVCESKLNPNAKNGDYGGMFQFSTQTWITTRKRMNKDTNPQLRFDSESAIHTAAFRIATIGAAAWPNCQN